MTYLTKIAVFSVGLSVMGMAFAPLAQARVTADQMTCAMAVASYEKNGRIYVRSGSGTVLPIYDGVPVSQKTSLSCPSADEDAQRYNVRTSDAHACTISYRCRAY